MGGILSGVLGTKNDFQSNPYQHVDAWTPPEQQQFGQNIQGSQNGINGVISAQGTLAGQLRAQSMGAGPNPAMAQLNQTTGQNIQNATGMIASQRGINPALAARMAAQNASSANQTAAGQGAVMRAQQQLAAQGQLQGLYGSMNNQQLQNQQILQAANAAQNNTMLQGYMGANQLNSSNYNNAQSLNAGAASQNANTAGKIVGGLAAGLGGLGASSGAFGSGAQGAQSSGALFMAAAGGQVPQSFAHRYLHGRAQMDMKMGGKVPGQAKVRGDSLKNDTVPAMLSPREIVLPRSVTLSKDAPEKARAFVAAVLARQNMRGARK